MSGSIDSYIIKCEVCFFYLAWIRLYEVRLWWQQVKLLFQCTRELTVGDVEEAQVYDN